MPGDIIADSRATSPGIRTLALLVGFSASTGPAFADIPGSR
jgi:hypothetical protein